MSTRLGLDPVALAVALVIVGGGPGVSLAGGPLPATGHRPAMVPIAPGTFTIGSPAAEAGRFPSEPVATVRLTRGFWMAETEVTQDQFAAVMGRNPSRFRGTPGDGQRPVESVNWIDAVRYCNALSKADGLRPAYGVKGDAVTWDRAAPGYRLPTAAEWEYAARAGTGTATYAGDLTLRGPVDAPELHAIAWFAATSASTHPAAYVPAAHMLVDGWTTALSTHPVRRKRPNGWGLYDMLGNVWEWTWNHSGPPVRGLDGGVVVDPTGPEAGPGRVIRGGGFRDSARVVRAAVRGGALTEKGSDVIGFRPVRAMPVGSAPAP